MAALSDVSALPLTAPNVPPVTTLPLTVPAPLVTRKEPDVPVLIASAVAFPVPKPLIPVLTGMPVKLVPVIVCSAVHVAATASLPTPLSKPHLLTPSEISRRFP